MALMSNADQRKITAQTILPLRSAAAGNTPQKNIYGDIVETRDIVVDGVTHRTNVYVLTRPPNNDIIPSPVVGDEARVYLMDTASANNPVDYEEWVYGLIGGTAANPVHGWVRKGAGGGGGGGGITIESDPVFSAVLPTLALKSEIPDMSVLETAISNEVTTRSGEITRVEGLIPDAPDLISADANNALTEGTDGLLFVPPGGGGISDAPSNGKIYGRQDGGWEEIADGGASDWEEETIAIP